MRLSFLFMMCLFLAACGFKPVYAPTLFESGTTNAATTTQGQLATVFIENIPDRNGQILRNELLDRLNAKGAPQRAGASYVLQVSPPQEEKVGLGIAKDASVTRAQLRMRTSFTLLDKTGQPVFAQRNALSIASYNTLGSQYKTIVTENDVREQALADLAGQITAQVEMALSGN